MNFYPMNSDQSRLLADAGGHYDQWLAASRLKEKYAGWMSWRVQSGVEYLISGSSGGINQKSHGPRSPATERVHDEFVSGKERAKNLAADIALRLNERAPLLKAARLGRILAPLAKVVRSFDIHELLGVNFLVGGTHAITVYEALSGQLMQSDMMATEDLDFIWLSHTGMELLVKQPNTALLALLKQIDDTYTVNTENTFQVRNSKGLMIDFISDHHNAASAPNGRLKPIGIDGQEWLLLFPPVSAVCVDTQGAPVRLFAPDPRVFALHKFWVSKRADRNPLKSPKDVRQAFAIVELIVKCMPQYPFDDGFLGQLPPSLLEIFNNEFKVVVDAAAPNIVEM